MRWELLISLVILNCVVKVANSRVRGIWKHGNPNGMHLGIDKLEIDALPAFTCAKHYSYVLFGSVMSEIWALKFFDSWGKLPSGILSENDISFGHFDQCICIEENVHSEVIEGQYCLAEITISDFPIEIPRKQFFIGICIPRTCDIVEIQNELIDILESLWETEDVAITNVSIFRKDLCTGSGKNDRGFDEGAIVVCILFGIIVLLLLISTGYDGFTEYFICRQNDFLLSFSLIKNWRELFTMEKFVSADIVECLYGIRSIAMLSVLSCWSYHTKATLPIAERYKSYEQLVTKNQQLSLCTEIFFLISGFLVTWSVFKEMKRTNSLNFFKIYIHRYIRLLPVIAVTLLFCTTLFKYIGNGPLWNAQVAVFEPCQRFWWSYLIFLQNFVNPDEMCLPHTWYLSVNMQLYFTTVLLLLPLYRWRLKFGWIMLCLVIACMTGVYFTTDLDHHQTETSKGHLGKFYKTVEQILNAAVSWLIGMCLGYTIFLTSGRKMKISKHMTRIGWILSLVLLGAAIFGIHVHVSSSENSSKTKLIRLFSKFFGTIGISWIIFASSHFYGGPIRKLLTWQIWQPFSKLCYAMFVVHFLVITYHNGVTRTSGEFTNYDTVQQILGQVCITAIVSIVIVLFVELPVRNLAKVFSKLLRKCFPKKSYNLEKIFS